MVYQTAGVISVSQSEATPGTRDQPSSYQWDLEDIILKVARAISDDDQIERLGRALGFEYPDIKRFIRTNLIEGEVTTRGTKMMLREWAETVSVTRQQQALRIALTKAELVQIEEKCLPNQGHPSIPSGSLQHDELMSPEMKKFQKELKDTYCRDYSTVKTSPLDPESEKRLQQIYVKLELILEDEKKEKGKKPLEYDDVFDIIRTETESGLKTRFAFIGEAGVGKSTLLAMIAFDWATGKCLQEIAFLFLLPLQEVMKTKYFGDIALNYVSDDIELEGKEIDGFIRNHQKQVLFLFDGLDESKLVLKSPDRDDAGVSILRGEKFRESAVIVTTRPSHVEQIEKIRKQYTFVQVEGFTKENMAEYVRQFFEDDTESSSGLEKFMQTHELIAEHMAPYPIFCSMLCHLWKSKSKREKVQELRTFSQIMKELVFSLQEQYCSKYSEDDYANHMKRTNEAMAKIGSMAFEGLLIKQLVFKKDENESSVVEDAVIACKLGILTKERKLLPREIRLKERVQFVDEFRFPHKLMQEFMAGQYLASLYNTDLSEFKRVLREKLLRRKKDFRYVLYFTAAHGGAVGGSVMEALCHVHQKDNDLDFIMEVAFECQDMEAIDHVVNLVKRERMLGIDGRYKSHHTFSGYLLTVERCGQRAIRTSSTSLSNASATSSSSYTAAIGLFTLENLRRLKLDEIDLDDDFCTGMTTYASKSQIEELSLDKLTMTRHSLHTFLSLPCLQSLSMGRGIRCRETDNGVTSVENSHGSSVEKLSVCSGSVVDLWKLGLHTSCPRVHTLTIVGSYMDLLSSDIVSMACSPFPQLTVLGTEWGSVDPVSFCDAMMSSCPRLHTLFFTSVEMSNEKATEIIQSMKTHPQLKRMKFFLCETTRDLDPLIAEVNREGSLAVKVRHDIDLELQDNDRSTDYTQHSDSELEYSDQLTDDTEHSDSELQDNDQLMDDTEHSDSELQDNDQLMNDTQHRDSELQDNDQLTDNTQHRDTELQDNDQLMDDAQHTTRGRKRYRCLIL